VAEKSSELPSPSPIARPRQAAAGGVVGPFGAGAGDADTGRHFHSGPLADETRGVNQQPRYSQCSVQDSGPLGPASVAFNGGAYTHIGELVEANAKLISSTAGTDLPADGSVHINYYADASAHRDRSSRQESRFEPESTADLGRSDDSGGNPIAPQISSSGFMPSGPPSRRGSVVLTKSQLLREACVGIVSG